MSHTKERTHRNTCPALQAWDVPGACNCDRPALRVRCGDEDRCPDCGEHCRRSPAGTTMPCAGGDA